MDRRSWWRGLLKKARNGDAEAQYSVGVTYIDGEVDSKGRCIVVKDPSRAVYWYRRSAEQGNGDAQNQLGCCFSLGQGVRRDFTKAISWIKKAVGQRTGGSANNLATVYRDMGQYRRAFKWYQREVQMGYLDSLLEVGIALYYGIGVKKDPVDACDCFKKILSLKNWTITELERENASFMLALAYLEGKGARPSLVRARIMLESADREGDHLAAQLLLRTTARRCNMKSRPRRAELPGPFTRAMQGGTIDRRSWQALLNKARKGDVESQYLVGVYFDDGEMDEKGRRFVKKDPTRAVYWYRRAAEQGHLYGQMQLGACLSLGRGVQRDFKQAIIWTKKAVEQNASCSAHNLATIYRDMGQYRRAYDWYQRSVKMGELSSWMEIGMSLYYGIGVERDPVEACKCFKKILSLKNWTITELERENASFMLALAYLDGKGVRPSLAQARIMLERADRESDHQAAQCLLWVTGRRSYMKHWPRRSAKGKSSR